MGKKLINLLNQIDKKLENLKVGEVLDISNLEDTEAGIISKVYSKEYFIKGPVEDKENKGRYALAFIANYRGDNHA